MIEIRNRFRVATTMSALLLGLGCSPQADPKTEIAQSPLLYNSTLSVNLLSVVRGETGGTEPPDQVSIRFPTLVNPSGVLGAQVPLGACTGPTGGTQSCNGLQLPPVPWTKSISIDGNQPPQTITYAGELTIVPFGGNGSYPRCFHFGLNTETLKLTPVPPTAVGCPSGGPPDNADPVTCDDTTCTAEINIVSNGTMGLDHPPWRVKFGYHVTPPTTTGTILVTPNYIITHVDYAPPGAMSTMSYEATTTVGTTTSITSSFENSATSTTSVSATVTMDELSSSGELKFTEGHSWGTTQEDEVDIEVERNTKYSIPGRVDGIDHGRDEIWLLLSPQLNVTVTQPRDPNLPATTAWAFVPNQDGINHAVPLPIYVAWLTGEEPWDTTVQGTLEHFGVTSSDYQNILSADPLAAGALLSPRQDPNRFALLGTVDFTAKLHAGDPPSTTMTTVSQTATNTSTSTSTQSFTTGISVEGSGDFAKIFTAKLTLENTLTWTDSSSLKSSHGNGTTDELLVSQPEFGYQGPIFLRVYEDTIFKTYAFALEATCGGTGVNGQFCNMDNGAPLCLPTVWGFEPGDAGWQNSGETASSITTAPAHSGGQALQVSASSDPTLPASIASTPCYSGASSGTMDLRGRTYSAWVLVANSASSYAGTYCRLRAFDQSFNESEISMQAINTQIAPGFWFQLSGVFPSTVVEQQIYKLAIDCSLPGDWSFGDPSNFWVVDDIRVN